MCATHLGNHYAISSREFSENLEALFPQKISKPSHVHGNPLKTYFIHIPGNHYDKFALNQQVTEPTRNENLHDLILTNNKEPIRHNNVVQQILITAPLKCMTYRGKGMERSVK